jgi:hypothetical protein
MGFYSAPASYTRAFRQAVDQDEKAFLKIISALQRKAIFEPDGDFYKRNLYCGASQMVARWYNRKNLLVAASRDRVAEIYDFGSLLLRLGQGFSSLAGLYNFWLKLALDNERECGS